MSDSNPENLNMKDFNAVISGGTVHLKPYAASQLTQPNHHTKPTLGEYNCRTAIISAGINDFLHCQNNRELDDLPTNILKLANASEECNIGKLII